MPRSRAVGKRPDEVERERIRKAEERLARIVDSVTGARGKERLPELSDMAEAFIRVRGGAEKVAQMLSEEWDRAAPGSIARTRILDMLLRTWKAASQIQENRIPEMDLVSEEDLQRELDKRLKEVMGAG